MQVSRGVIAEKTLMIVISTIVLMGASASMELTRILANALPPSQESFAKLM